MEFHFCLKNAVYGGLKAVFYCFCLCSFKIENGLLFLSYLVKSMLKFGFIAVIFVHIFALGNHKVACIFRVSKEGFDEIQNHCRLKTELLRQVITFYYSAFNSGCCEISIENTS